MKVYLAGPLFNAGERGVLAEIAARLRALDFEVFVPHEQFVEQEGLDPKGVYVTDLEGLRAANAVLAWLDGTQVATRGSLDSVPIFEWCAGAALHQQTASTSLSPVRSNQSVRSPGL